MLSDHERKVLLALEQQLRGEDPEWALTFDVIGRRADRQTRFELTFFTVATILSMSMFGITLASHALAPALFLAAATALLVWHIRRLRRRARPRDSTTPGGT